MKRLSPLRRKQQAAEIWQSPAAFASSLLLLFIDNYGTEGLRWDPLTILMEIEEDFDLAMPSDSFDRLMAAVGILTTDGFYKNLPDFILWCNILSGDSYNPALWVPEDLADAAECAWGISEALLINPPEEEDPFAPEIIGYIGDVLAVEGIINPPDVLKIAQGTPREPAWGDFDDDPEMFAAIYEMEQAKTSEINAYVKGSLERLVAQLKDLPLQSGDTSQFSPRDVYAA